MSTNVKKRMVSRISEGTYALGGLTVFAIWVFVVLPIMYLQREVYPQASAEIRQSPQQTQTEPKGTKSAPFFVQIIPDNAQMAREDEDREEKKDADRWLVRWTFALFVATLGLMVATGVLGYFAYRQLRDTKEALVISGKSADAATLSANVADQTLKSTQRAFVFMKYAYAAPVLRYSSAQSADVIDGWDFHIVWENSGPTPTQHMITYQNLLAMTTGTPSDLGFPDVVGNGPKTTPRTYIGPASQKDGGAKTVPLLDLDRVLKGNLRLFGWGWAEYSDLFRPGSRSRTEYAFEVIVRGDLRRVPDERVKPPFEFVVLDGHNGCEDECCRRPGSDIPVLRPS